MKQYNLILKDGKEFNFDIELMESNVTEVIDFISKYEIVPESLEDIDNFKKLMEL